MRWLFGLAVLVSRGDRPKNAELLVLRHENAVLRRNTGRVQYEPADRVWFAALTRFIQIRRKPVLSGLINKIRASRLKPEKAQVKAGILFSSGTAPGTACTSCSPSMHTAYPAATRSPASTSREPSTPATGPPLAHKNRRRPRESCPSCVRATAGPSGTQWDPGASTHIRLVIPDLRKYRSERPAPSITARDRRPRAPIRSEPLTSQNLAHHWPTATGDGLPNRSFSAIEPLTQVRVNGSDLGFWVAGVGFEPT
jgi:hypothetical protein